MRPGLRLYLIKPGWMNIEVSNSKNPMTMQSLTLHQIVTANTDCVIILIKTLT